MAYQDILTEFQNYFQIAQNLDSGNISIPTVAESLQISSVQNNLQNTKTYFTNVLNQQYFSTPVVNALNTVVAEAKSALDTIVGNSGATDVELMDQTTVDNLLSSFGFTMLNLPLYIKQTILSNLVQNYKIKGTLQSVANIVQDVVSIPILISELYFEKWCEFTLPIWSNYVETFPTCLSTCLDALNIQPYTVDTFTFPNNFQPITTTEYICGNTTSLLTNTYNENQTYPWITNGYSALSFSFEEPYNVPGTSGSLLQYLQYSEVVDKYWMLTEEYLATEYPFSKAMSPYFIGKLYVNTNNYLYAIELLKQYAYQQYLTYVAQGLSTNYVGTRNIVSEYLTNPYNYYEAWLMIRYLWMDVFNIQTDNVETPVRGRYQYFATGTILAYNDNGNVIFYGGSYCVPTQTDENTVSIIGMNSNIIAFNSSNVNIDEATIIYENGVFTGSLDLAKFFLLGSSITENISVTLYGQGNQLLASPQITNASNISNYTGTQLYVGSYGPGITFDGTNFTGYLDIMVAYDKVAGISTILHLVSQLNQIVITIDSNITAGNNYAITGEMAYQFATRFTTPDSTVTTIQLTSTESNVNQTVVLDYGEQGIVKALDLGNRTNFQLCSTSNKLIIFGGYLNGELSDEILIIDPYETTTLNTIHTGIFLLNPVLLTDGYVVYIYGGNTATNTTNNIMYLINVDDNVVVQTTNTSNLVPYSSEYYTAVAPDYSMTYMIAFNNNEATVYRIRISGSDILNLGTINNVLNNENFSAICTSNGELYIAFQDTNNQMHVYKYNDTIGLVDYTNDYFIDIQDNVKLMILNQICKYTNSNNNYTYTTSFADGCIQLIDNLVLQNIFSNFNQLTYNNLVVTSAPISININNTFSNYPGTIDAIFNENFAGELAKWFANYTCTPANLQTVGLSLDQTGINEFITLFTTVWFHVTNTYFDWNDVATMYYNYEMNMSLQNRIIQIIICCIAKQCYGNNNVCDVSTLPQSDLDQIYTNLTAENFNVLLSIASSNYTDLIFTLSPLGNIPMLLINKITDNCDSSTIVQRYIGNISPSVGVITDITTSGTILYLINSIPTYNGSTVTTSNTTVKYTPSKTNARTFRELTLGYPNTNVVGTRDFDLQSQYPLWPVLSTQSSIANVLNTINTENYNTLVSNPDKSAMLYDILSSVSKLTDNVDFTMMFASYTLNNVSDIVDIFKPIQSRGTFFLPSINIIDPVGDWISMGDYAIINILKQMYDYLLLHDSLQRALTLSIGYGNDRSNETVNIQDVNIIQVSATEELGLADTGNVSEIYSYSVANYIN